MRAIQPQEELGRNSASPAACLADLVTQTFSSSSSPFLPTYLNSLNHSICLFIPAHISTPTSPLSIRTFDYYPPFLALPHRAAPYLGAALRPKAALNQRPPQPLHPPPVLDFSLIPPSNSPPPLLPPLPPPPPLPHPPALDFILPPPPPPSAALPRPR